MGCLKALFGVGTKWLRFDFRRGYREEADDLRLQRGHGAVGEQVLHVQRQGAVLERGGLGLQGEQDEASGRQEEGAGPEAEEVPQPRVRW